MQMDQVTQQNAALVEEMAAAASSLKSQANELVDTVAVFKLTEDATRNAIVIPAATREQALTATLATARAYGRLPFKGVAA